MYEDARIFPQLFDVLLREDALDVLAVNLRVNVPKPGGSAPSREFSRAMSERLKQPTDRLVVAFSSFAGGDLDPEVIQTLAEAGVPFLESTETTMQALRHAREHRRFLDRPVAARADWGAAAGNDGSERTWRACQRRGGGGSSASSASRWRKRSPQKMRTRGARGGPARLSGRDQDRTRPTSLTRPMPAGCASGAPTPPPCAQPSATCSTPYVSGCPRRGATACWCSAWSPAAPR